jgi:hypothetical protein
VVHLTRDALLAVMLIATVPASVWAQANDRAERAQRMSQQAEARGLAEPFKGVTTNGTIIPSLFAIHSAGVPTEPVRAAAAAFLASLAAEQRAKTSFPVDDLEWRKWMNQHLMCARASASRR